MTGRAVRVAAIDLGASSGRVMVGEVGPHHLALTAHARFANDPVLLPDGLHWDVLDLYRHALDGLWTAVAASPDGLQGVAVDSWAVDYAALSGGRMLGVPYHYRDERTALGVEKVHRLVPFDELYARNGLQFLAFNTLYQLAADPLASLAEQVLLVPDLIGYWLTGEAVTERTNASTTGLLDPRTGAWDVELAERIGLEPSILTPVVEPGSAVGAVRPQVGERIGAPDLQVTAIGSHDTASAVVGVPMASRDAAYISCGTWGLVGLELDAPIMTDAARKANFTNEGGVDGRTRFLTNVMGTWLLSETLRAWRLAGQEVELTSVLAVAASVTEEQTIVDVQDPRFVAPGDMPARIAEWCHERGLRAPEGPAATVRCIVDSLAAAFADALTTAATLADRRVDVVHVVGGGSQNTLLCQAVADRTGLTVLAGPVEATALGNVLVQARTLGAVDGTLEDLRALIAETHSLVTYRPR